jgi:zinc D-Ala-D-Ala carboxypeptidase
VSIGSITSPGSTEPLGLIQVQERIAAIRRRIGADSAWGATAATTAPGAKATGHDEFSHALAHASATGGATGSTGTGTASPAVAAADAVALSAIGAAPLFTTKPEGMPPVQIPDAIQAAGNGRLPDSLLASIGGGHQLSAPAAEGFNRLNNAAKRDGVTIGLTDSYRNYADQVDVAARKGIYGQGGWAAVPGTSNHGWGLALDLDLDDKAQSWMRENAWKYGFYEDVPGEPWHWTYRAG